MRRDAARRPALAAAEGAITVAIARTEAERRECYRVRHRVYCAERGFEPTRAGAEESDAYDAHAAHALVRGIDGTPIGTVRLIGPGTQDRTAALPMRAITGPSLLDRLPLRATGEVSRLALAKVGQEGAMGCAGAPLLGLLRGVAVMTAEMGLTHLCALVSPALLRLLARHGLRLHPLGPPILHRGLRQPTAASVTGLLAMLARDNPALCEHLAANLVFGPAALRDL